MACYPFFLGRELSSKISLILVVIIWAAFQIPAVDLMRLLWIIILALRFILYVARIVFRGFRNGVARGGYMPVTKSMSLRSESAV